MISATSHNYPTNLDFLIRQDVESGYLLFALCSIGQMPIQTCYTRATKARAYFLLEQYDQAFHELQSLLKKTKFFSLDEAVYVSKTLACICWKLEYFDEAFLINNELINYDCVAAQEVLDLMKKLR